MPISGELRQSARECLARARELIARNQEAATRYACLELRQAIEYLAYQQLDAYLDEVPDDAMRKWTPRDVIAQMLTVDPTADKTASVSVGVEQVYGQPAAGMETLGEDRRFTLKWANRSHNALGSFLHAPTLHQFETGNVPDHGAMREKAEEVAAVIDHTLASPIYNANFGEFYEIDCVCGRRFKRRAGSFTAQQGIVCPNTNCRTIWDVASEKGTRIELRPRQTEYVCPSCKGTRYLLNHKIKAGGVIVCDCGGRAEICLSLSPFEEDASSPESAP
ncbi:hypothetical protein [Bradyrhizobium arachidis]|uniref:hypothetical protein n=1 Tax=Bradyrhizobium arachidis TaxID=858423 RepID=UPI002161BBD8|nr:hypothetical protein [Bradyrhizobium arachidis]UVO28170.1 hypothetical protein KUF59_37825 [Bradyrhizobium arachidis]